MNNNNFLIGIGKTVKAMCNKDTDDYLSSADIVPHLTVTAGILIKSVLFSI